MAIFLNEHSKVIVQGLTGSEGRKHSAKMLAAGTNIVGGVNALKNALMPLRQTRRGSVGRRCTAPMNSESTAVSNGSSRDSSTASLDLK